MGENNVLTVSAPKSRFVVDLMIACLGSCFLALMSQLAIHLSITPVSVTLQTLAVFLLGGVLGARRGAYSVIAYLIQGCCVLPVFAGGVANPLWILGPQAGFLISFVVAGFLIGKMMELKPQPHILYIVGALTLGQLVIFALGWSWLSFYAGTSKAFMFGVVPFLGGAFLKILAGSLALRFYTKWRRK